MSISEVLAGFPTAISAQTVLSQPLPLEWLRNKLASYAYQAASYASDPPCNVHQSFREIDVVDSLNPHSCYIANLARKVVLFIGIAGWSFLAVFTSVPGVALRFLGKQLQTVPYSYEQTSPLGKALPSDRSFSLLSWNVCGIPGGFSISDGGVVHWKQRIDAIIAKVIEKDADVNCLYEVFDIQMASYVIEALKKRGYTDFYFNMEPKEIGISAGILFASKYKVKNPQFTLFPQDSLVGITKFAAKGVFQADLENQGAVFASVFATHMQQSEEPKSPSAEEVAGRKVQMQIIVDKINHLRDRCVVVAGDWNLDDREYEAASWRPLFQKGDAGILEKTWGGDEFCAKLMGRRPSGPLNLDYTVVLRGTARSIATSLVKTDFDATVFKREALSDHLGQFSRIQCF